MQIRKKADTFQYFKMLYLCKKKKKDKDSKINLITWYYQIK